MVVPTLYAIWWCPFAQTVWISLRHKGIKFDVVEQDPYNKTPEWLAINPTGLVPALKVGNGKVMRESNVCVEYIDEKWPHGPKLLPTDPYERARARIWAGCISQKIFTNYYKILQRPEMQREPKEELSKNLITLIDAMSTDGPFFSGKEFGMVDILLVPHAFILLLLKDLRNLDLSRTDPKYDRFYEWFDAVCEVESVRKTLPDPVRMKEYLVRKYPSNEGHRIHGRSTSS